MGRRIVEDSAVRNLQRTHGTYYVTIPIELIRELGWKAKQKVVVKRYSRRKLLITDWEK